jgi:putative transposase
MLEDAFKTLEEHQKPTLHSDQGWQYRMAKYKHMLNEKGITQSMSRKGNCYDNAIIENFFGTIKSEMFYLKKYTSVEELKNDIKEYIKYYNNDRIKLNLNGMSPIKYRAHHYN